MPHDCLRLNIYDITACIHVDNLHLGKIITLKIGSILQSEIVREDFLIDGFAIALLARESAHITLIFRLKSRVSAFWLAELMARESAHITLIFK